jgi:hypothetical protein
MNVFSVVVPGIVALNALDGACCRKKKTKFLFDCIKNI